MRKPDENTGIIFKAAKKPGTKQPDFKGQLYVTKPGVLISTPENCTLTTRIL